MSEVYRRKGRYYARTATGGCANCVFGANKMGLCLNGKQPSFAKRASDGGQCSGLSGPAWEEVKSTTKSTQKPKEPKTMSFYGDPMKAKKPGTSHGKPTTKGLRIEKKPTSAKVSKYPAARVQVVSQTPAKHLDKMTKLELIETYYALRDQFDNQAADHCIAGTKLDRAIVDLKEAKKRIKELEAAK